MLPLPAGSEASSAVGAFVYERHRPERTLLYQLVQDYYPAFKTHLAVQGTALPAYVEREFEDYLRCGRLEHGFMFVRCDSCHAEQLVALSCKRRGLLRASCAPLFRPAFGCSKSLPAILSVQAVAPGAWPRARRCWWTRCSPSSRCGSGC